MSPQHSPWHWVGRNPILTMVRSGPQDTFSPSLLLWAEDQVSLVLYINFKMRYHTSVGKGEQPFIAQQLQIWTYIEWYFQEQDREKKASSKLWAQVEYILLDEKLIFLFYIRKYHANREGNVRPWNKASSHHVSLCISKIKLPSFFSWENYHMNYHCFSLWK